MNFFFKALKNNNSVFSANEINNLHNNLSENNLFSNFNKVIPAYHPETFKSKFWADDIAKNGFALPLINNIENYDRNSIFRNSSIDEIINRNENHKINDFNKFHKFIMPLILNVDIYAEIKWPNANTYRKIKIYDKNTKNFININIDQNLDFNNLNSTFSIKNISIKNENFILGNNYKAEQINGILDQGNNLLIKINSVKENTKNIENLYLDTNQNSINLVIDNYNARNLIAINLSKFNSLLNKLFLHESEYFKNKNTTEVLNSNIDDKNNFKNAIIEFIKLLSKENIIADDTDSSYFKILNTNDIENIISNYSDFDKYLKNNNLSKENFYLNTQEGRFSIKVKFNNKLNIKSFSSNKIVKIKTNRNSDFTINSYDYILTFNIRNIKLSIDNDKVNEINYNKNISEIKSNQINDFINNLKNNLNKFDFFQNKHYQISLNNQIEYYINEFQKEYIKINYDNNYSFIDNQLNNNFSLSNIEWNDKPQEWIIEENSLYIPLNKFVRVMYEISEIKFNEEFNDLLNLGWNKIENTSITIDDLINKLNNYDLNFKKILFKYKIKNSELNFNLESIDQISFIKENDKIKVNFTINKPYIWQKEFYLQNFVYSDYVDIASLSETLIEEIEQNKNNLNNYLRKINEFNIEQKIKYFNIDSSRKRLNTLFKQIIFEKENNQNHILIKFILNANVVWKNTEKTYKIKYKENEINISENILIQKPILNYVKLNTIIKKHKIEKIEKLLEFLTNQNKNDVLDLFDINQEEIIDNINTVEISKENKNIKFTFVLNNQNISWENKNFNGIIITKNLSYYKPPLDTSIKNKKEPNDVIKKEIENINQNIENVDNLKDQKTVDGNKNSFKYWIFSIIIFPLFFAIYLLKKFSKKINKNKKRK